VEGGGERVRPGPAAVDLEAGAACAVDEAGGDVQQPVAQGLRLGFGEIGLVVQENALGPGDEVDRDQRADQPRLVDRELPGGEPAHAGVLAGADAVFDAGVAAVAGIQPGVLPEWGVGGDAGVAPAIAFFEQVQLCAGMRAFPAHDDAHPVGVSNSHDELIIRGRDVHWLIRSRSPETTLGPRQGNDALPGNPTTARNMRMLTRLVERL
jgi:hypothetical protein